MKFFACVLDASGHGISSGVRERMQSTAIDRSLTYRWDTFPGAAVLTGWDEFDGEIAIERYNDWTAVGQVRLDNRPDVERRVRADGQSIADESDLALALRFVARSGLVAIPELVGDFGFIAWHAATRTAIGGCDAFNHARLYYNQHRDLMLVGSRAEPLSMVDTYDIGYLADILLDAFPQDRTVYAGVHQVPAASTLTLRDGRVTTSPYWSVSNFEPSYTWHASPEDAAEACRDLLTTAVRLRLDTGGRTWSQLSGGLDSSAVVSIVQQLAERGQISRGLDGTITFVMGSDTSADERPYSEAIVKRWGVRNEVVVDAPMWYDEADHDPLPLPDQPLQTMMFAPIDARFRAILRDARARVLLTGFGSDHLFTGCPLYLAERFARGHVVDVLGELAHRAALVRTSFWRLAYTNVVKPFIPGATRWLERPPISAARARDWLRQDTYRRVYSQAPDPTSEALSTGPVRRKYANWLGAQIVGAQRADETRALSEVVSVRHPFLYRPLVEFALRMPPEWCARPLAHKWIFREAMKGVLPEVIRTRVLKGGGGDTFAHMFIHQKAFLRELVRDPILADLGLVDRHRLATALEQSSNPATWKGSIQGDVLTTLSVEAWLQLRSGRWPHGLAMSQAPIIPQQDTYQLTVTQRRSV
jgi:asparagine synthase (glutamine-hydrolysing)